MTSSMTSWRNISLWMDQLDEPLTPRPALTGAIEADVVIIGAGFTGLWTAYYLKQQAPELDIVVLEAQCAGFGASGRNGGWLIGELAGQDALLAKRTPSERHAALELLHAIPDEVARVIELEGIDCDFVKGGMLTVAARYPEQTARLREYFAELQQAGYGPDDQQWLDQETLAQRLLIDSAEAAIYSPHCARIQPAKLVRGLAATVERLGVRLYEQTPATGWQQGLVTTPNGSVRCQWVVPAVEAYASQLPSDLTDLARIQLPVQSLIIATEPLSDALWEGIGLAQSEVFSDYSHQITYAQRSQDNRLVFGARGGYRFGKQLRHDFELTKREVRLLHTVLCELFPQLAGVTISHAWGGNLGVARAFHPHMVIDRAQGYALAGGYGGEGVGASNLAGRTLADLILQRNTLLTQQPWVRPAGSVAGIRAWEPEPIPFIGYSAISQSFDLEDRLLSRPQTPSWLRRAIGALARFMAALVS